MVENIDEGVALLTGPPAGKRAEDGISSAGSVHGLVAERLSH